MKDWCFACATGVPLGVTPPPNAVANLGLNVLTDHEEVVETSQVPKGKGGAAEPFVVSESLYPVPAKVVAKIGTNEYVDMAEILRDNIELERRQVGATSLGCSSSRREVPDLLSWIVCYGMFASVMAEKYPEGISDNDSQGGPPLRRQRMAEL